MKKLSILFLSVLALGLSTSSCSSSDDDNDNDNGNIEAKWQFSELRVVMNGQEVVVPSTNSGCDNDITEFKADGKFVDTFSEPTTDGKCTTDTDEGTWTKEGNTLTKKFANSTDTYEITELSGNTLKLKETYTSGGVSVSSIEVYKKI